MPSNMCDVTGIRYGFLSRSAFNNTINESFHHVLDDIMDKGTNITAQYRKKEFTRDLENRLEVWKEDHPDAILTPADLGRCLDYTQLSARDIQQILDDITQTTPDEEDLKAIVAEIVRETDFYDECGDDTFWRRDGDVEMLSSTFGGARGIDVISSPWVTDCRECSPCAPNAGDLGAPDADGVETFTLPRDWLSTPEDTEVPIPRDLRATDPARWAALQAHRKAEVDKNGLV